MSTRDYLVIAPEVIFGLNVVVRFLASIEVLAIVPNKIAGIQSYD